MLNARRKAVGIKIVIGLFKRSHPKVDGIELQIVEIVAECGSKPFHHGCEN